jgi:hypothetical protein
MTRPLLAVGLALAFVQAASSGVPNPCALVTNAAGGTSPIEPAKALARAAVTRL